ncbi:MAG: hypothetical protein SNJ56_02100 [Termitinemataceae bacterium]
MVLAGSILGAAESEDFATGGLQGKPETVGAHPEMIVELAMTPATVVPRSAGSGIAVVTPAAVVLRSGVSGIAVVAELVVYTSEQQEPAPTAGRTATMTRLSL